MNADLEPVTHIVRMLKMKKYIFIILIFILSFLGCLGGKLPKIKSDVPVVSYIDWWPYQEALQLTDLKVKTIYQNLNLFNNKAIIEIQLQGQIKYKPEWKPYIKEVQISERWQSNPSEKDVIGDIYVVPVINVKNKKSYNGVKESFSINVQHIIRTTSWGYNKYRVTAGTFSKEFEILQSK